MDAKQLVDFLNSVDGSCCWAIENENYSGGPDSELRFDCPDLIEADVDSAALAAAGDDFSEIEVVTAKAVENAFFRTHDTSEITDRWLNTCGAYCSGFRDALERVGLIPAVEIDEAE